MQVWKNRKESNLFLSFLWHVLFYSSTLALNSVINNLSQFPHVDKQEYQPTTFTKPISRSQTLIPISPLDRSRSPLSKNYHIVKIWPNLISNDQSPEFVSKILLTGESWLATCWLSWTCCDWPALTFNFSNVAIKILNNSE